MPFIDLYELSENQVLSSKTFTPGSFICCKDTHNIYMVPTAGGKPVKMSETTIFITESERLELQTPINNKKYFCKDSGKLWIYLDKWICINPDILAEYYIEDVSVPKNGSTSIADKRLKDSNKGEFIPDTSVSDLNINTIVSCSNGSATITTDSKYDIFGKIKIT